MLWNILEYKVMSAGTMDVQLLPQVINIPAYFYYKNVNKNQERRNDGHTPIYKWIMKIRASSIIYVMIIHSNGNEIKFYIIFFNNNELNVFFCFHVWVMYRIKDFVTRRNSIFSQLT